MKAYLFAAALAVGGTAIAQTGNTVNDPSQASGPRGVTQQGTDPDGQACTPVGFNQNSNAYPPCMAPAGTPASDAAATRPCSRTVTDHCIQTYERGVRRRR
jgi:hypothetical protein